MLAIIDVHLTVNPLTPTVAVWIILCQTGLSCHL